MSEIPDDIKKIAEELFAPYNYLYDGPSEEDVARLILAERQRCAKIVDDWPSNDNYLDDIVAAIRGGVD